MKKTILTIVLGLFIASGVKAQTTFERTYGGTDEDYGSSVQQTYDGGYIIAGWTESLTGGNDVYLIKTDEDGDTVWTKTYGGTRTDEGFSVQQTSDSGYIVVGHTYSFGAAYEDDVWLIKTDSDGDTLWTKAYGESNHCDRGYSVQQTNDRGYIITGYTESYGLNYAHVWLIKTDSLGNILWDKTFGGADNIGYGRSVQQTNEGGYIITGWTDSYGTGDNDVWLIKTDSSGNFLWDKKFGRGYHDYGRSVRQTNDGGYIVTGETRPYGADNSDVWLIKTYANGDTVWTKTYGGSTADRGWSVRQTFGGGYIITGYTTSGAGSGDVWLIKADSSGNKLWDKTFGGSSYDYGRSVQQTNDGGYIVTGITSSYGAGNEDVYLIKTDGDGFVNIDNEPLVTNNYLFLQNYPNPFKTETTIRFSLKGPSHVELKIYNIKGQLVKKLVDCQQMSGKHSVVWDGSDENGKAVSNEIYLYRLHSNGASETRKMLLIK
ncbi:MAG: FlgD immunoglobulin-like domain containing protein [Candidatus Cloacimonadota bacterium]|nr:FlgD immunoglobulin-like domain containing protein [Candidatus Cloacimonadota bacterium]